MNDLEDRLRTELPELADHLIRTGRTKSSVTATDGADVGPPAAPTLELLWEDRPTPRRRWTALTAAAIVAVIGLGAASVVLRDTEPATPASSPEPAADAAASTATAGVADAGVWTPIADAPIDPRPYAVSAWTGDRAIFWAGSSLDRGFAYSDGAAYDPATDTWSSVPVPGWGHPGLTSTALDGTVYALAKGGGTRFDAVAGTWTDLPPVDRLFLAATVATDDAVWGLGPVTTQVEGQPDLGIVRYDPTGDRWIDATTFVGTDDAAPIVNGLGQFESSVFWDGTEIIVWRDSVGGLAFEPATETWRPIAPPTAAGEGGDAVAATTDAGFVLLQEVTSDAARITSVAVWNGDGWRRSTAALPIMHAATATLVGAGDWLVVFSPEGAPITLHVPSGHWERDTTNPLAEAQAPNTVWTGAQLIAWGGDGIDAGASQGAIWTPPA